MTLGIDATMLYELGSWSQPAHQSASWTSRRRTTPARCTGLPPTPICNPGLASMQAAAHPAKVNYLYYVATG